MNSNSLKIYILSLFISVSLLSRAQPGKIRLTHAVSAENFAEYFNTDTVRLIGVCSSKTPTGVFVTYEKADTLNFKHEFYRSFEADNYTSVGLAFYSRKGNDYLLSFKNNEAFFCKSCNNMRDYNLAVSKDTVSISISWGPNDFGQNERYDFIFRPALKRWQLMQTYSSGSDDLGQHHNEYTTYPKNTTVYLDEYNAETLSYDSTVMSSQRIILYYRPGDYAALLRSLKEIPENTLFLLPKIFNEADARYFIEAVPEGNQAANTNPIHGKNVLTANEIGYFLEQKNQLEAAQVFLDKVIAHFPEREVAYLNRGDVFFKKGQLFFKEAARDYQTYIELMNRRGLQAKIPKRIVVFLRTQF